MGALGASYPFVLYSDLYDHRDFIRGNVQTSGFSGILWTPEDKYRECERRREECIRRVQALVFSVQLSRQLLGISTVLPWEILGCGDEVREAAAMLRQKLIPRLKAAFDRYHTEGIPPVRALVMDYTDDAETYKIDDEWLFCDDLLVAPIIAGTGDEREVYIPAGEWVDYFTDEPVEAGWRHVNTKGIPVYRRVRR